jgi:hypothetical protein
MSTSISKAEVKRRLKQAFRRTSIVGDEVYFPARWTFGDNAGDASTSVPVRRHARTERHARMEVAASYVANGLMPRGSTGIGFWLDDDDESTLEAVASGIVRAVERERGAA